MSTPAESQDFIDNKGCHHNDFATALVETKNPILFHALADTNTEFSNIKSAVYLLELGADVDVAILALRVSLAAEESLDRETSRELRLFSMLVLEELRYKMGARDGLPVATYLLNASGMAGEALSDIKPYCVLYAVEHRASISRALETQRYQDCALDTAKSWLKIRDLVTM